MNILEEGLSDRLCPGVDNILDLKFWINATMSTIGWMQPPEEKVG